MTGYATRRYGQFEISPEAIEQELRPADCKRRQTEIGRLYINFNFSNFYYYNYTVQRHEQRYCWNGSKEKINIIINNGVVGTLLQVGALSK